MCFIGFLIRFEIRPVALGIKITEVIKVIKNQEPFFILTRTEYIGRESCASAYHLQEFYFRPNRLKEYQIQNIGYIDTGIQHVHTDSDLGQTVTLFQLLNEIVAVFHMAVYQNAEIPALFRI